MPLKMGRRFMLLCLTLGLVCLALFLGLDYGTAALGHHLLVAHFEDLVSGDCSSVDTPSVRISRSLSNLASSAVPEMLNGLRVSVSVSPFNLEDNERLAIFREMGPWVLHVEVEDGSVWVMQDSERSCTTVEQPIHNANLLTVLAPIVVEDMAPDLSPYALSLFPVTFTNMSILERVSDAWTKMQVIIQLYNGTEEGNVVGELYSFLSMGRGAALVYNGSSFYVDKRNISAKGKSISTLPPLSLVPIQYHLPGLPDLTWHFWRSDASAVGGVPVNQYEVKDIWEPGQLCRMNGHVLYDLRKRLQDHGVFLAPPESLHSQNFAVQWSGNAPFSAILGVYRPFGVPIGASLTAQVNILIPSNASDALPQSDITPVVRVTMQVEELPAWTTVLLFRYMYIRMAVLLFLATLTVVFFAAGSVIFVRRRQKRERGYIAGSVYHDPL